MAFSAGLFCRDVVRIAYGHYLSRKWNREWKEAEARMVGCKHERTEVFDYGLPTLKCLDCWAIQMPDGKWTPNSVDPSKDPPPVVR